MRKTETIMCVPNILFENFLSNGFNEFSENFDLETLTEQNVWFIPREEAERNNNYRQIIPYIIIKQDDKIFMYERSLKGSEHRLHGFKSLGIGGHINLSDIVLDEEKINVLDTISKAEKRELYEEVKLGKISAIHDSAMISNGFIYYRNDSEVPDVNKVHIGIVSIWDIQKEIKLKSFEDTIIKNQMIKINDIGKHVCDMELWSQEIVNGIIKAIL